MVVILVPSPERAFRLSFRLTHCRPVTAWRSLLYTATRDGFIPSKRGADNNITELFPPRSIAVLEIDSREVVPVDHGP